MLTDSVETKEGKLCIQPDAYFVLGNLDQPAKKDALHFFLEADVGTMSHARIAEKIRAYAAYHQQQRHVAKFGIPYLHVVVVTQTRARAENLRAELYPRMSVAQRRAYHIVSLDALSFDELLGATDRSAA